MTSADQRGFTLIELLTAMALLALLAALMVAALRLGQHSLQAGTEHLDQSARLMLVHQFVAGALDQAEPARARGPKGGVAFAGNARSLRFVAPLPAQLERAGRALITLEFQPGKESGRLVLRWRRLEPDGPVDLSDAGAEESTLQAEIATAEFSFFGPGPNGLGSGWQPRWQARPVLPTLVRLRLSPRQGGPWPDLIARPRLAETRLAGG